MALLYKHPSPLFFWPLNFKHPRVLTLDNNYIVHVCILYSGKVWWIGQRQVGLNFG